jgi:UDP-N-acetylmuramyl pentapeptide phosphotransferase/UDP-N-acetylglucosamine-1-phosphate transferase
MSDYRAGEIALILSFGLLVAAMAARMPPIRPLSLAITAVLFVLASVFALSGYVNATEIVAVFDGLDATPGLAPFIVLAGQGFIAMDAVVRRRDRGLARMQPVPRET